MVGTNRLAERLEGRVGLVDTTGKGIEGRGISLGGQLVLGGQAVQVGSVGLVRDGIAVGLDARDEGVDGGGALSGNLTILPQPLGDRVDAGLVGLGREGILVGLGGGRVGADGLVLVGIGPHGVAVAAAREEKGQDGHDDGGDQADLGGAAETGGGAGGGGAGLGGDALGELGAVAAGVAHLELHVLATLSLVDLVGDLRGADDREAACGDGTAVDVHDRGGRIPVAVEGGQKSCDIDLDAIQGSHVWPPC